MHLFCILIFFDNLYNVKNNKNKKYFVLYIWNMYFFTITNKNCVQTYQNVQINVNYSYITYELFEKIRM